MTTNTEEKKSKLESNTRTSSPETTPEQEQEEEESDEEELENTSPKKKDGIESTNKSKIDSSSYYFSKSTDPEKAKQFQPQKIDEQTAKAKEQQLKKLLSTNSACSLWNTGSTMEEYDYSEWIHQRLKQQILNVEFKGLSIKIDEVEKVDGTATYLYSRGKLRAGWDLNLKAKWKGTVDGKDVEGSFSLEDIADGEDADEWNFEVECKKSGSEDQKAKALILSEKKKILNAVQLVLTEFKSKKVTK